MSQEESKYLWVMRTSRKFAAGRRDSNGAFQSRSLRSRGTRKLGKVEKRIERWSRLWGNSQGKYTIVKDREIIRSTNYRGIIKSILLFTTLFHHPTVIWVGCYSEMNDSLRLSHDSLSDFHDFLKSLIVRFSKTVSSQI